MARQADLVILHHFGHDVIPIAALAVTDVPPVALHNHADHLFWMGGTVADTVCQLRGISRVLSDRRFVQNEVDLPIPLATAAGRLSREEARQQLAIPQDQVALVSVGRACKYIPTPTHDFLRTANAILEEHPQAHVYLVGVSAVEPLIRWDVAAHPRFHFVGPVEDPALYQQAADVYLEGFPFGSQTGCLESALAGLPVVLAYAPPLDLLATSDEALDGLTVTPTTEEAYRAEVSRLLADPRRHLRGQELRERVLAVHTGEGWRERLEAFYRHALSRPHAPRKLPASPCVASTRDVALSYWHELNGCSSLSRDGVGATIREVRLAAAHGARQAGQHRTALRLLCGSLRRWGWSDRVAKAILTLGLHWIAPPSRREPRPRLAGSRRS